MLIVKWLRVIDQGKPATFQKRLPGKTAKWSLKPGTIPKLTALNGLLQYRPLTKLQLFLK